MYVCCNVQYTCKYVWVQIYIYIYFFLQAMERLRDGAIAVEAVTAALIELEVMALPFDGRTDLHF